MLGKQAAMTSARSSQYGHEMARMHLELRRSNQSQRDCPALRVQFCTRLCPERAERAVVASEVRRIRQTPMLPTRGTNSISPNRTHAATSRAHYHRTILKSPPRSPPRPARSGSRPPVQAGRSRGPARAGPHNSEALPGRRRRPLPAQPSSSSWPRSARHTRLAGGCGSSRCGTGLRRRLQPLRWRRPRRPRRCARRGRSSLQHKRKQQSGCKLTPTRGLLSEARLGTSSHSPLSSFSRLSLRSSSNPNIAFSFL